MFSNNILPELRKRWSNIQSKMNETTADACLIGGNVNLFYVADRVFSGFCYISQEGDPIFFVKRPIHLVGKNVVYIRKPEDIPAILQERGIALPKSLLLETDELSYNEIIRLQTALSAQIVLNGTSILRAVRTVKSDFEIDLLRQSGKLHADCYRKVPSLYSIGMSDLDLSIEIEKVFRQHGSLGYFRVFGNSMEIFMGSLLAGKNAEAASPYDFAMGGAGIHRSLPVGCNGTLLTDGMAVMVDMGGTFTGYISDMSRVFSVGKLANIAYYAHQVSIDIQNDVEAIAKPGVVVCELYNLAYEKAKKHNLTDYFMGYHQKASFIGHGVGIEINESPVLTARSKEVLMEGNIFALEPKFVIPGTGAVGIENTFQVTKYSIEKLTLLEEQIIEL